MSSSQDGHLVKYGPHTQAVNPVEWRSTRTIRTTLTCKLVSMVIRVGIVIL